MDNAKEELEIYRTVAAMSGDTLYRYSIGTDDMEMFYGRAAMSKYGSTIKNYSTILKTTNILGETDKEVAEQLFQIIATGEPGFFEFEIQMKNRTGAFHWYKITGKTVYDDDNNPKYIVGKVTDIDEKKMQHPIISENIKMNELTGVLNAAFFTKKLNRICKKLNKREGLCTFIAIDGIKELCINNPDVNEESILVNASQLIKEEFTFDVAIGRVKYSEFCVVYMGDGSKGYFLEKLNSLLEQIRNMKICGLYKKHITAYAGVYCGEFNEDGEHDILDKTQIALNAARYHNSIVSVNYSDELEQNQILFEQDSEINENYNNAQFDRQLIEKALDIMYQTGDIEEAVNQIFKRIGLKYGLDRVMVQEMNTNDRSVSVTYSWVNENNPYIKGRLNREKIEDYNLLEAAYDGRDIIVVDDASKMEVSELIRNRIEITEIKSFVQCIFRGSNGINGCVGFECYSSKKKWTETEIKTFRLITKLVSSYLLNMRIYEEMLGANRKYKTHDALTGYYKYEEFLIEAENYIRNNRNAKLAIVYTSMKEFPKVNDKYGYSVGDKVLKLYAELLSKGEKRFIMGSRINADNFIVLVNEFDLRGNRASSATINNLNTEFVTKASELCPDVDVSINAGITLISDTALPLNKYIKTAVEACNIAVDDDNIIFKLVN